MNEPVWIAKALALAVHAIQLVEHGGNNGVRDETLLDSALARPKQLFAYDEPTPDLAALAASLAYSVARNHLFVDLNKPTALVLCRTFLALNDIELIASNGEKYLTFLNLAEGNLSEDRLSEWLRSHLNNDDTLYDGAGSYG